MTPIESSTSTSNGMGTISSNGNSRISQLIDQVKTSNGKLLTIYNQQQVQLQLQLQLQPRGVLVTPLASTTSYPQSSSDSPMSISPAANSPMELVSYSSDDNDYTRPQQHQQQQQQMLSQNQFRRELTLDQKIEIQKHIRNKLRPRYKPNEINTTVRNGEFITSEEDYIKINKTISRKIYNYILKQKLGEIDEFFTNEDKLRNLIDKYIE